MSGATAILILIMASGSLNYERPVSEHFGVCSSGFSLLPAGQGQPEG